MNKQTTTNTTSTTYTSTTTSITNTTTQSTANDNVNLMENGNKKNLSKIIKVCKAVFAFLDEYSKYFLNSIAILGTISLFDITFDSKNISLFGISFDSQLYPLYLICFFLFILALLGIMRFTRKFFQILSPNQTLSDDTPLKFIPCLFVFIFLIVTLVTLYFLWDLSGDKILKNSEFIKYNCNSSQELEQNIALQVPKQITALMRSNDTEKNLDTSVSIEINRVQNQTDTDTKEDNNSSTTGQDRNAASIICHPN